MACHDGEPDKVGRTQSSVSAPCPTGPGGKLSTRRTPSGGVLGLLLGAVPGLFVLLVLLVLGALVPSGVTVALDKGLVQLPPRCTKSCQPAMA